MTNSDQHDAAADERNRVRALAKHEGVVRARERRRITAVLLQDPQHEYQTPACSCSSLCGKDHLDPPGAIGTDFPGCVV